VRADNPCNGDGVTTIAGGCGAPGNSGQFGTTSLPPNNQAHTFNLQGGVNLPMRTRVNANFTYQLRFQNQDFQQQTYSNGLVAANPSLQLPQSSLNGNVQTALFNLDVTSLPLQAPVTFTLKYRLYDYINSDRPIVSAFIVNDQNAITQTVGQEPMRAGRYSFLRQNADVAGRYQFTPNMAVTLGLGWEGWNRSHDYEVTLSNEALAKAAFDYTPTDWLLARLSYTAGFPLGGGYNTNAWGEANMNQPPTFNGSASQLTTLRKFNEGDRNQQVLTLMTQVTPNDTLTFTPSASYKYVDYISSGLFEQQAAPLNNKSLLGLQQVVGWNAGMDINWTPSDRIAFTAHAHESLFQKQRNRNNGPNDFHGLDLEQHRHHRDLPRVDQGRHCPREVVLQDRRGVFPDPRARPDVRPELHREHRLRCECTERCRVEMACVLRQLGSRRRRARVQFHQGLDGEALLRLRAVHQPQLADGCPHPLPHPQRERFSVPRPELAELHRPDRRGHPQVQV
jgi:hypothetical protein